MGVVCRKTGKLTTVSSKSILECFWQKKIIERGSTVSRSHLAKKKLLKDDILGPLYDYLQMTGDQITSSLSVLFQRNQWETEWKEGLDNPIQLKYMLSKNFFLKNL